MSRYGASTFSSLLDKCVLWAPLQHSAGVSGDIDEFPILPSGVTVTNNGTFTKTDLGNNKSVLNFDGSTNYISLGTSAVLNLERTDVFTICYWLKGPITGFRRVIGNMNAATAYTGFCNSLNQNGANVDCYFELINNTGTGNRVEVKVIFNNDSNWYHITITYLGTSLASGITIYVNGSPSSQTVTVNALTGNIVSSNTLSIGRTGALAEGNNYAGNLKDLMIWKGRALTQPEIKLLMNRTHPITGAGLMPANGDYWRTS